MKKLFMAVVVAGLWLLGIATVVKFSEKGHTIEQSITRGVVAAQESAYQGHWLYDSTTRGR